MFDIRNKQEQNYIVPDHYKIVSDHFVRLSDKIKNILVKRECLQNITNQGNALNELKKILKDAEVFTKDTERFSKNISKLLAKDNAKADQIKEQVDVLNTIIEQLGCIMDKTIGLMVSNDLVQTKQWLIAATEKILRDIFSLMEKFICCVNNPTEAVKKYGSQEITLHCSFDFSEENKLLQNCSLLKHLTYKPSESENKENEIQEVSYEYKLPQKRNDCSGFSLLMAFLLGCWIGDD